MGGPMLTNALETLMPGSTNPGTVEFIGLGIAAIPLASAAQAIAQGRPIQALAGVAAASGLYNVTKLIGDSFS